jgi:hypothetical protein
VRTFEEWRESYIATHGQDVSASEAWDAALAEFRQPQGGKTCRAEPKHPRWALRINNMVALLPICNDDAERYQYCSICAELALRDIERDRIRKELEEDRAKEGAK